MKEEKCLYPYDTKLVIRPIRDVLEMIDAKTISFDSPYQRPSGVWNHSLKCDLISSLLCGFPTGTAYGMKKEGCKLDILDGQQRLTVIHEFCNGEFKLSNQPLIFDKLSGEKVNVNSKKFAQLPKHFKDAILDYSFKFEEFYGTYSRFMEKETFRKCNQSIAVKKIIKTTNESKYSPEIRELTKHSIFEILSDSKRKNSVDLSVVIRSLINIFVNKDDIELNNAKLEKILMTEDFEENQFKRLHSIFDFMYEVINSMENIQTADNYELNGIKNVKSKFNCPNHFFSFVMAVDFGIKNTYSIDAIAEWAMYFFDNKRDRRKASISEEYNSLLSGGTSQKPNANRRIKIILNSLEEFVKENYPRY